MNKEELNDLFNKELSYIFKKYSRDTTQNFEYYVFTEDDNYRIITSSIIVPKDIAKIVKDILYALAIHDISIIHTKDFIHEVHTMLCKLWKHVNYQDYDFKFSIFSNNQLILTVFPKDPNPKITASKALFQIEDQKSIRKFIMDIIENITDKYEEYELFTIKEGGINIDKEYSICINSTKMKQILKDYTNIIIKLGYKE